MFDTHRNDEDVTPSGHSPFSLCIPPLGTWQLSLGQRHVHLCPNGRDEVLGELGVGQAEPALVGWGRERQCQSG